MVSFCFQQQVIDSGKEKNIGKLKFPLAQLLKSGNMLSEQPFPLKESGQNSTLTCKFILKVQCNLKYLVYVAFVFQWMVLSTL